MTTVTLIFQADSTRRNRGPKIGSATFDVLSTRSRTWNWYAIWARRSVQTRSSYTNSYRKSCRKSKVTIQYEYYETICARLNHSMCSMSIELTFHYGQKIMTKIWKENRARVKTLFFTALCLSGS